MPRNGSGTFSFSSGYPFTTGTVISSTDVNAVLLDVANTFTASLAKDGQTTATADIPMGGFKFTSVGDAALRTQFPSVGQLQDGTLHILSGVAGTNSVTGALTPSIATTGYVTGMRITFAPANTNSGATTLAVNSLAAKNVYSFGAACVGGELVAGRPTTVVYDGTQFQIQNPQIISPGVIYGITASAAEINILDGATLSTTELNYVDGVTSAIQTQLDAKLASASYTAADVLSKLLTVDGAGSGLDADLLDGESSAAFHAAANLTGSHTLSDGVLSTNVPLLGSSNVFTALQTIMVSGSTGAYLKIGSTSVARGYFGNGVSLVSGAAEADMAIAAVNGDFYVSRDDGATTAFKVGSSLANSAINSVAFSDFARLSQANTFTTIQGISTASASNTFTLTNTTTNNAVVRFLTNSAGRALIGTPGANGNLAPGSVVGDLVIRMDSGGLLFTGNDGSTTHFALSSAGALTTPNASASEAGYKGTPQNTSAVDASTVLTDCGKQLTMSAASKTWTIDDTVAYPVGTVLAFVAGANGFSIACSTAGNLHLAGTATTGTRTLAAYGVAAASKQASGVWVVSGAGLS